VSTNVDLEQVKAALLESHRKDRRAHYEKDVDLLLTGGASEFISVSNGEIQRSTLDEQRAFFMDYFTGAKYYEGDDLEPPIIRVSNDASIAWMIVRIKVRRTTRQENSDEERETQFIYAGIMTYEKQAGKWRRTANVSTFAQ